LTQAVISGAFRGQQASAVPASARAGHHAARELIAEYRAAQGKYLAYLR
jgi:hypothetical protein